MGILSWVIVGLIAGWLAGELMRGSGFGLIGNGIVGVIGALIGGLTASSLLGFTGLFSEINATTVVVAFVGSILMLGGLGLLRGKRTLE